MIEDGVTGSSKSLTRVTTLLRKICSVAVRRLERQRKMQIGGRGAFVAIDESKFRHKRKVKFYFNMLVLLHYLQLFIEFSLQEFHKMAELKI